MKLALLLLPAALLAQVKVTPGEGQVGVEIDGQPFTTFYMPAATPAGNATPKPYLHPLKTAGGKVVSRGYPMENIPGETRDHPHHRGLWFTHGDVNGIDFWVNEAAPKVQRQGIIVTKKLNSATGGKTGVIDASFEWQSSAGTALLSEDRKMTFYPDPKLRVIDFDVTFTALDKVKFGDTKEGFFAIRLRDELTEVERRKGTGTLVSAEGGRKMAQVWGKRSPWVDYSGEFEGEKLGVAIFDHPGNPKHPTYWHARDYGLFAANAFGEHDFLADKTKDGSITLEKGEKLRFRYRVVIHPGDTASAGLAEQYQKYAATK